MKNYITFQIIWREIKRERFDVDKISLACRIAKRYKSIDIIGAGGTVLLCIHSMMTKVLETLIFALLAFNIVVVQSLPSKSYIRPNTPENSKLR